MTLVVAIVAASEPARAAIQRSLEAERGIDIVASTTLMTFSLARLRRADVLILDHELPFEIIRQLIRTVGGPARGPGVVVVGAPRDSDGLIQYIEFGLRGYVLDSEPRETLVEVVRMVADGGARLDSWLAGPVIEHYRRLREQLKLMERRNGNDRRP